MKKIAVDTMRTFLKEHKAENITKLSVPVGDSSFELEIKTHLTVTEKSTFISRVLSGCFDVMGNFRPEYVSPMMRATILQMCTNLPVLVEKGVKTENGESAMDMEAMDALYMALDLDNLQDASYQQMMGEIAHLCGQAIDWKRGHMIAEISAPMAEGINALGYAADAVRSLIEELAKRVKDMNMTELLEHAGQLSEVTKGMAQGDLAQALIQLHEANKDK